MMNLTLEQTINKTCLIGLSYFDTAHNLLKQTMLAGTVTAVDKEMGITVSLLSANDNNSATEKTANFILPTNLSCWFIAPKGDFHTSQADVKVNNPDYLITWDIYQTKAQKPEQSEQPVEGEQQWWEWRPRIEQPQIG